MNRDEWLLTAGVAALAVLGLLVTRLASRLLKLPTEETP